MKKGIKFRSSGTCTRHTDPYRYFEENMSRIRLPDVRFMSDEQKELYDLFPSNLVRALLATTCSTKGYISLGASFPAGKLADKDREMVILRVGALSKSPYERMQHLPLALKAGWSEDEIGKMENGTPDDEREKTYWTLWMNASETSGFPTKRSIVCASTTTTRKSRN